jgi:hypothetical protein
VPDSQPYTNDRSCSHSSKQSHLAASNRNLPVHRPWHLHCHVYSYSSHWGTFFSHSKGGYSWSLQLCCPAGLQSNRGGEGKPGGGSGGFMAVRDSVAVCCLPPRPTSLEGQPTRYINARLILRAPAAGVHATINPICCQIYDIPLAAALALTTLDK